MKHLHVLLFVFPLNLCAGQGAPQPPHNFPHGNILNNYADVGGYDNNNGAQQAAAHQLHVNRNRPPRAIPPKILGPYPCRRQP